MNHFVNPNTRDVTLPAGCKDLIHVLKQSEAKTGSETGILITPTQIGRFIQLVLFQAQRDGATEIVIGSALPTGGTSIRYKVKDTWHSLEPFPSHIRSAVISELAKMAKFPAGQISGKGFLEVRSGALQLTWVVTIMSPERECALVRVTD